MLVFESNTYEGLWACKLSGNTSILFTAPKTAFITNVALGNEINGRLARTTLGLCPDPRTKGKDHATAERELRIEHFTAICSLLPSHAENFSCRILLSAGNTYILRAIGLNPLNLVGYFVDDTENDGEGGKKQKNVEETKASFLPLTPIASPQRRHLEDEESKKNDKISKQRPSNPTPVPTKKRVRLEVTRETVDPGPGFVML